MTEEYSRVLLWRNRLLFLLSYTYADADDGLDRRSYELVRRGPILDFKFKFKGNMLCMLLVI